MHASSISRKLDRYRMSVFQRKVLLATCTIPRGKTLTYKQIAKLAGRPRACRAVGNALNMNPLPVLIPCHRVVRSDGTLGGYRFGTARKRRLLESEGALASHSSR